MEEDSSDCSPQLLLPFMQSLRNSGSTATVVVFTDMKDVTAVATRLANKGFYNVIIVHYQKRDVQSRAPTTWWRRYLLHASYLRVHGGKYTLSMHTILHVQFNGNPFTDINVRSGVAVFVTELFARSHLESQTFRLKEFGFCNSDKASLPIFSWDAPAK